MFDHMPQPDDRPLPIAPIQLATFQLDFEEERRLVSQDGIRWQKRLQERGYRLPRIAPVRQRTVNVTLPSLGATAEQSLVAERTGWQVFLDDGVSNLALFATALNIERANYPGYEQFRQEVLDAFEVTAQILEPRVQSRVYLSYANALSHPDAETPAYWRDKVKPYFLGPPSDDILNTDFSRSLSIFSFEEGDYAADLKVAVQPDQVHKGRMAFVFQSEIVRKGVSEIELPELRQTVDELHAIALKLFYAVLEPQYVAAMRAVEV